MKLRQLVATVVLVSWPAGVLVGQQKSDTVSKILALEAKWNDAYKRNDVGVMNSLLADDFLITVEDGTTYSKSGYIALAGGGFLRVEISEMSNLKVNVHGDVAVVTDVYHERGTLKGEPYENHDRLTDVWVSGDGK
jgi:ketosteroid isomerase-like protein